MSSLKESQIIKEAGKIQIPPAIRKALCLETDDKISIIIDIDEDKIKIFKHLDNEFTIDEEGIITIPKIIFEELDWRKLDELMIELSPEDETIGVAMLGRNRPECVFCDNPKAADTVLVVNYIGICQEHLDYLVGGEYEE